MRKRRMDLCYENWWHKGKGGEIVWAVFLLFSSPKMVSFYFFANFSNLLQVYFFVFAFSLWKIVT